MSQAPELILHHFPRSPFSQRVLLALAIKKIPFKSFMVAPIPTGRPVTNALVGGYRRIPVLQIGADLYCDTSRILALLEDLYPQTPLTNKALSSHVINFAPWHLFPADLKEDREKALGITFDQARLDIARPISTDHLTANLALLEESLSDGRKFILGDSPTHADIHVYQPVWSLNTYAQAALKEGTFGNIPHLLAWFDRMVALAGPEEVAKFETAKLTAEETFAVAVNASKALTPASTTSTHEGKLSAGHRASVIPDDTFKVSTEGVVVSIDGNEVVLQRSGEWNGTQVTTHVHFPRLGFVVSKSTL